MLPLSGIRVIEFCQVAAGPFCGMLLADMGADVIKIEPPGGDPLRQWPPLTNGFSENFASLNRNKRSVMLNLKSEADRRKARAVVLSADVVVENNRPGVMDRLGLGYESFKVAKPDLVYCSISAFGQSGPRTSEGGFDLTIQAISGVMSVTGEPNGVPVKCGVPIADFAAGLYAAFAVTSVLNRVRAGGEGSHIDMSMLGATLGIAALQTSEYFGTGCDPRKLGSAHPRNAPYQAYSAKDGYFTIAAGNDRLWQSMCAALGRPELVEDARFASTAERAANQEVLKDVFVAEFANRTVAELLATFSAAGVPCAPINRYSDVLADSQVAHMGWIQPMTLPHGTTSRTFTSPIKLSGQIPPIRRMPPALGADTHEVLSELACEDQVMTLPRSAGGPSRLRSFIVAMTELIDRPKEDEAHLLFEACTLLEDLIRNDDWLPEAFAQPGEHSYNQYLLHCDPLERFSLVSFVWGPGQSTPIHNHTVWGLVGMLRGSEVSQPYSCDKDGRLAPAGEPVKLEPGAIEKVSPQIGDIHSVANACRGRSSISVHLYGGNIGALKRSAFDLGSGVERVFVSGYSNTVVPNFWH